MLHAKRIRLALTIAALGAAILLVARTAPAGPPAICHPIEIGDAKCLSGDAYRGKGAAARLADDATKLLGESTSALVHMETLRRTVMELDRAAARDFLTRLMARALDAEAEGKPDAFAWFDAGYYLQCYHQLHMERSGDELRYGVAEGVAGYAWVRRAIQLRGDDAEMEFGAAVVTVFAGIPQFDEHVARAKRLAPEGSLVLANVERHARGAWTHARGAERGARR